MRLPLLTIAALAVMTVATIGFTRDVEASTAIGCSAPVAVCNAPAVACYASCSDVVILRGHRARKARRVARWAARRVACSAPATCGSY